MNSYTRRQLLGAVATGALGAAASSRAWGGTIYDLSLAELSRDLGYETHVAGDCDGVAYIEGAIHSAHAVARAL